MNKSESINELAAALALAQGEMLSAEKDGTNPHFRSSYATLASVWDAIRKPLSGQGLSIVQSPGSTEGGMMHITTILLHKSGQYIEDIFQIPAGTMTPQGMGSAITYARRYTLMAICGIAPDDDDGNDAAAQSTPKTTAKPAQQTVRQGNWRDDQKAAQAVTNATAKPAQSNPTNDQAQENIAPVKASKEQLKAIQDHCDMYNFTTPKHLDILTAYEADQAMARLEAALAKRLEENKKVMTGAAA